MSESQLQPPAILTLKGAGGRQQAVLANAMLAVEEVPPTEGIGLNFVFLAKAYSPPLRLTSAMPYHEIIGLWAAAVGGKVLAVQPGSAAGNGEGKGLIL